MWPWIETSRDAVGSSRTMRPGCTASARATATRCAWPPESSRGYRRANAGGRRTSASRSATRCRRCSAAHAHVLHRLRDRARRPSAAGSSDPCGSWKTAWIRCVRRTGLDRSAGSSPSTRTVPRVGRTQPQHGARQRRLPGARLADDGERLAGADLRGRPRRRRPAARDRRSGRVRDGRRTRPRGRGCSTRAVSSRALRRRSLARRRRAAASSIAGSSGSGPSAPTKHGDPAAAVDRGPAAARRSRRESGRIGQRGA